MGFTAAQASLNVAETIMYLYYMSVIFRNGSGADRFFSCQDLNGFFIGESHKSIHGPGVASGVLVLFSAAVLTLGKTLLYCESIPPDFGGSGGFMRKC